MSNGGDLGCAMVVKQAVSKETSGNGLRDPTDLQTVFFLPKKCALFVQGLQRLYDVFAPRSGVRCQRCVTMRVSQSQNPFLQREPSQLIPTMTDCRFSVPKTCLSFCAILLRKTIR